MNIKRIYSSALSEDCQNAKPYSQKGKCFKLAIAFLPLFLSVAIYFLATLNGNNTTSDSLWYKSIAENLATKGTYTGPGGKIVLYWPPLYSMVLAVAYPYIESFVLTLNCCCFVGVLLVWQKISGFYLNKNWTGIFTLCLAIAVPVVMLSVFMWTEILFLFLFSYSIFFNLKFLRTYENKYLLIAAFFSFFMMLTRNAGFFLFVGGVIGLLINYKAYSRKNLLYLFFYILISVSGFAIWNSYVILYLGNWHIPGELLPHISLGRNFFVTFRELGLNFVPDVFSLSGIVVVVGLLVFLFSGVFAFFSSNNISLLFLFITLSFYVFTWLVIPADNSNISRFLAVVLPIYYLLFVMILSLFGAFFPKIRLLLSAFVCSWVLYSFLRVVKNVVLWGGYEF